MFFHFYAFVTYLDVASTRLVLQVISGTNLGIGLPL